MLSQRKRCDDKKGLGFSGNESVTNNGKIVFVRVSCSSEDCVNNIKEKITEGTVFPVKTANK